MSEENVEVVRQAVAAANRGDPDAFIACLRSDVEWEESGDVLPGLRGVHRGWADVQSHSRKRSWNSGINFMSRSKRSPT